GPPGRRRLRPRPRPPQPRGRDRPHRVRHELEHAAAVRRQRAGQHRRPDRRRLTDRGLALLTPLELSAWRGLLENHARITRALDAEMRVAHGLPVSSYEVLMFLGDAPEQRLRM